LYAWLFSKGDFAVPLAEDARRGCPTLVVSRLASLRDDGSMAVLAYVNKSAAGCTLATGNVASAGRSPLLGFSGLEFSASWPAIRAEIVSANRFSGCFGRGRAPGFRGGRARWRISGCFVAGTVAARRARVRVWTACPGDGAVKRSRGGPRGRARGDRRVLRHGHPPLTRPMLPDTADRNPPIMRHP